MARKANIIGSTKDIFGDLWDVREELPTDHGFNLLIGWPQAAPRGPGGGGGPRAIITEELASYLERYRHNPKDIDLPIGKSAIKRLRRLLGHHYRHDRNLWWDERFEDLISLTIEEFAKKHNVSTGAVSQWRAKLVGAWICKVDEHIKHDHVRTALCKPTCVAADILGISVAHVRRLKKVTQES